MNILAIETSSGACSIALKLGEKRHISHQIAPREQTKLLLPAIQSIMAKAGVSIGDIDAIAYGAGPGSFTGIRIAHSVATGLAFAANKPVIPISSLAALALTAAETHHWQHILVAIDARMGDLYSAAYEFDQQQGLIEIEKDQVIKPEALKLPNSGRWYGVGDAFTSYPTLLINQLVEIDPQLIPTANSILTLAEKKYQAGDLIAANLATPIYLR